MPQVKYEVETKVILTLNEREARWLRGVLQNPVSDAESVDDVEMRVSLFESLNPGKGKKLTNCGLKKPEFVQNL